MMRRFFAAFLLLSSPAMAQDAVSLLTPMVADISQDAIEIHSSFTGAQLLLFGVRGPNANVVMRRKERIAGMWMHVEQEKYFHLPLFYAIASTRPLELVAPASTLQALGLGSGEIINQSSSKSVAVFDDALTRHLSRYSLWQLPFAQITFFGETLFKAKITLPDRLPRGQFTAEAYLFDRGQLVSLQTIPLTTYKTGFDARVYDTAQKQPLLYGVGAILLALAGGWLAHRLFNRRA